MLSKKNEGFDTVKTRMVKKAIKGFIIAMSVLMLGGAYPNQAFAMECADNSGSTGVSESAETHEESHDSASSGHSDDSSPSCDSSGDSSGDHSDGTSYECSADTSGGQPESSACEYSGDMSGTNSDAVCVGSSDDFYYGCIDGASGEQPDGMAYVQTEDASGLPAAGTGDASYISKDDSTTDHGSDTKDSPDTEPETANTDSSDLAQNTAQSKNTNINVPPIKENTTSDDKSSDDEHHSNANPENPTSGTEPAGSTGTNTKDDESTINGNIQEEIGLSVPGTEDTEQNNLDNTDNREEAESGGSTGDDGSALFIKTGLDKSSINQLETENENNIEKKEEKPAQEASLEEEKERKDTEIQSDDPTIKYIDELSYNDQQYVLRGGESADLSEILSGVGLTGEIVDVAVSNPDLFTVTKENGAWIFNSLEPFNTDEWMKVTIDGVEYEIAVKDDAELTDISSTTKQTDFSDTMRFSRSSTNSFNIEGKYGGTYIKTTYNNAGYKSAIQVGDNAKYELTGFMFGKLYENNGVQIRITAGMADGGSAVALKYEVHNKNSTPVTVKFGSSADSMIGNNDSARVEFVGNTIVMEDDTKTSTTYGAKFILYPGDADFTTKWRGHYSTAYNNIFNNYSGEEPLLKTDSGIAWSWEVVIDPDKTIVRSGELGVFRSGWNVTFYGNGGTPEKSLRVVEKGATVSEPSSSPERKGYDFTGWYNEPEVRTEFDFTTPITRDKDLYAGWEFLPPDVTGPEDLELVYGYDDTNSIRVTAETADDAELSYQWYSCNSTGGEEKELTGETGNSYSIPTGKTAGDYYYFCNVSAKSAEGIETGPVKSEIANVKVKKKDITITAVDDRKVYDGIALIGPSVKDEIDFVEGDKLDSVTVTGSQTNVGSCPNVASDAVIIRESDGYNVTGSYNITYISGTLTVNKREITITADSDSKEYDGTALTKETCTYDEEQLAEDEVLESVTVEGSQTEAGSSDNKPIAAVIKHGSTDVTENYNITFENGTLTVTKRMLTITADSDNKEYDGTALTKETYTYIKEQLAPSDVIESVTIEGSRTEAGSSSNTPKTAVIKHGSTDVTASYNITFVDGTLTVTKRAITITADSDSKEYDGTPLTKDSYTCEDGRLATGDAIDSVTVEGSRTDTGKSPNVAKDAVIKRTDGTDVTDSYEITYIDGTLTVKKRALTITAASDSKVYDGTPLTNSSYTCEEGRLVKGDVIDSVTVEGSRTHIGNSPNVARDAVIKRADGTDVTDNYNIKYINGTLTVKKRAITITAASDERVYDGTPLIKASYTYEKDELALEDLIESVTVEGSQTDAGESSNVVKDVVIKRASDGADVTGSYDIAFVDGILKVTKRPLKITAGSAEKEYDGTALVENSYTQENLADKEEIKSVKVEGSQTAAGSSDNVASSAVILRGKDNVTANYDIEYNNGTLKVNKRHLEITAGSAEKEYDGTPLVEEGYAYVGDRIAAGEEIGSITVSGSQTDAGSSDNIASDVVIMRGKDDVTANYEIKYKKGTLTVTQAENPVTVDIDGWTYGESPNEPTATSAFGTDNIRFSYSDSPEGDFIEGIPHDAGVWYVKATVDATDNYKGGEAIKSFRIDKAAMSVTVEGYTGNYDGKEHSIIVNVSEPDEAVIYYGTTELNDDNFMDGSTEPIQRTDAGTTRVYFYVYSDNYEPDQKSGSVDIVINSVFQPGKRGMEPGNDQDDEDDGDEEHSSHSLPDPDALHAWYLINDIIVPTSRIGKIQQGPLAAGIFARARDFLLNEAFSFDLSIHDKTEYTLKRGKIVMYIPEAFQKKGRVFAVLGIDKWGKVHLFTNVGIYENLLTVNVDFEGYAFDLVYIDA